MIYVFSRDMAQRRMLLAVTSLEWHEKYCGVGTFTVVGRNNEDNAAMLRKGNVVHFDGYDGLIQDVVIGNTEITANGSSLAVILNQRTAYNDTMLKNTEADCYALYTANRRGLDVEVAEAQGFTETCEVSVENGGQLADWIEQACSQCGLGFRVRLDEQTLTKTLEIYKGEDLTSPTNPQGVAFSTATNTLTSLEIEDDQTEYANVAVVRGKDLQEQLVLVVVGTDTGADRYEAFVDCTSEPQRDEETQFDDQGNETGTIPAETLEEYKARLAARGQETLQQRTMRTSFEVVVPAEDFGRRYHLGDLVTCYSKPHGLQFTARVSEVSWTRDTKKESIEITLGEPKLRVKEMVKLWQK